MTKHHVFAQPGIVRFGAAPLGAGEGQAGQRHCGEQHHFLEPPPRRTVRLGQRGDELRRGHAGQLARALVPRPPVQPGQPERRPRRQP